jgi:peptidoglycan hydrolase-like protein with peptidoglycan-binding domain
MHRGAESSSVSNLQTFLAQKDILSDDLSGFYGDKTVEAVKVYQKSKGFPQTGMVYDLIRKAIMEETCQ